MDHSHTGAVKQPVTLKVRSKLHTSNKNGPVKTKLKQNHLENVTNMMQNPIDSTA